MAYVGGEFKGEQIGPGAARSLCSGLSLNVTSSETLGEPELLSITFFSPFITGKIPTLPTSKVFVRIVWVQHNRTLKHVQVYMEARCLRINYVFPQQTISINNVLFARQGLTYYSQAACCLVSSLLQVQKPLY